ncbi:MAG: M28 family peptidase [Chloroflexi bacterium]|nr:M28 family peptidase [Chloroflexota bacterium]
MRFNPETALRYASQMARPRRVGSGEEDVVARELVARLQSFGYQAELQPFSFTTGVNTAIAVEVGLSLLLIALAIWNSRLAPWAAIMILGLALLFERLNRLVEAVSVRPDSGSAASGWAAASNILATRPSDSSLPSLYLVAHYDSKSQRVPLLVRMMMFVVVLGGGVAFAALTLLGLEATAAIVGMAVIVVGLPLVFLVPDSGNESPGAIDNASGAGLVLHLAECLAEHQGLNVIVLITSAEEMAVMGAAAFVRRNESVLRQQAEGGGLFVLNFDGVGVAGKLYYADSRNRIGRLAGLITQIGNERRSPLSRFAWVGVLFDHIPFAQHGFDAVTLVTLGKASLSVHTAGDTADKLNVRGFAQAGQVALEVAEKLAKSGVAREIIA